MNQPVFNYALIKALYDHGHTFLDAIWPFVIREFPRQEYLDESTLQSRMQANTSLEIPLHVLSSILHRAKAKGYIKQREGQKKYILSERGELFQSKLEPFGDVQRRINSLADCMVAFYKKHGEEIERDVALSQIEAVVHLNQKYVLEFINPEVSDKNTRISSLSHPPDLLIEFLEHIASCDQVHYAILRDVFLGSLISTLLYTKDSSELSSFAERKFSSIPLCQ